MTSCGSLEIFNFVRFQKIKRNGAKRNASGTRRCLPKALTGRQHPKQTIGAFIFGIFKFFLNQQITASFPERIKISTNFLGSIKTGLFFLQPQLVEKPSAGRLFYKLTPFLASKPPKIKIGQSRALPRFLGYDLDLEKNPDGFSPSLFSLRNL